MKDADKSIIYSRDVKSQKQGKSDRLESIDIFKSIKRTFRLKRYHGNPIISPNPTNHWENFATTNPGATYDIETGKVTLIYRAAGDDPRHIIYFGLAESKDGYNFTRFDKPVLSPSKDGLDGGCLEDPRIVKIGRFYYITYATRVFPPGEYWLHEGRCYKAPNCPEEFPLCIKENHTTSHLLLTEDFKKFIRAGCLTDPMIDDRDVILFPGKINGKFYMLHRPMEWVGEKYGTDHPAIWISKADDLLNFKQSQLLAKAKYSWEKKIGGNTPPIKTKYGWLMLYHAVGQDNYYRIGAMLLDIDDPTKVRYRTRDWIFQPETEYETNGKYWGGGVVFPCGNVIIGNELFVYYGAADKYTALATCNLEELLDYLIRFPENDKE